MSVHVSQHLVSYARHDNKSFGGGNVHQSLIHSFGQSASHPLSPLLILFGAHRKDGMGSG